MTPYVIGIVVVLVAYAVVGSWAGRKVKNTNDYYVAGRRAPTILIVGSLVASFLSTGAYLGEAGEIYSGFFMAIMIVGIPQATGYIYGANLFGKYIRRAKVNTVPEYFGKRFDSKAVRMLASITLIFAVTAYLLSVIQGVSTLVNTITGWDYRICVVVSWLAFAIFTIYSGSMGVLLTDTIMFLVFLTATLIGVGFIVNEAGGWMEAITSLAQSTSRPGIIAWTNNLDYMYPSGWENLSWAVTNGIMWAVVIMVSPWQTSRYLMAKNEHTVLRSSIWASMGVVAVTISVAFASVFVYKINPDISDPSTCIIWAAMNCMPLILGVLLLTGIMSAGISSASTFLSLIGASLANDVIKQKENTSEKQSLKVSRIAMALASIVVLVIAFLNPPAIFVIMYFGGTVIASSWGVVAIASVWWKKMSKTGAFWGMLLGFLGCVIPKGLSALLGFTLPIYLDPFFIGVVLSILGIVVGSLLKPATQEDVARCEEMHVVPASEQNPAEMKKTHRLTYVYLAFGLALALFFVFAYAAPYLNAVG